MRLIKINYLIKFGKIVLIVRSFLIAMKLPWKEKFKKILTNDLYISIIIINILTNARNKKSKLVRFFRELRVLELSKITN